MEFVTLTKTNGMAEIRLHAGKGNSYDFDVYREINQAIDEVRLDNDIHVAILMSDVVKFFSVGANINFLQQAEPRYKTQFCLFCNETLDKIARSPQIFIAMIEGHCVGGGLEMAMACDLRFAADGQYQIGLPEVSLGVLPGTGGTQRMARLIGPSKALDLCITGRTLSPQEALQIGLVDKVYPADEIRDKTQEYAQHLCEGATYAVSNIKLSIMNGKEMPLNVAIRYEGELQNLLFRSQDAKEGIGSFLDRKSPSFQGV